MPIVLNGVTFGNGGTATYNDTELSSIQVSLGGADPVEVWRRSVTLVNLVGNQQITSTKVIDAAYNEGTTPMQNYTTVSGHKYFVRGSASATGTWTYGPASRLSVGSLQVASMNGPNNATLIPSSSSVQSAHYWMGSSQVGAYSACTATIYMVVDITPLEEATGRTFTAAQFWSYIGSTVFYGSKEFIP